MLGRLLTVPVYQGACSEAWIYVDILLEVQLFLSERFALIVIDLPNIRFLASWVRLPHRILRLHLGRTALIAFLQLKPDLQLLILILLLLLLKA